LMQSHAIPSGSTEGGVEGFFSLLAEIGRVVGCHSVVAIAEGVADVVSCASAGAAGVDWSRLSPGLAFSDVRDCRGPLCPAFSMYVRRAGCLQFSPESFLTERYKRAGTSQNCWGRFVVFERTRCERVFIAGLGGVGVLFWRPAATVRDHAVCV